MPARKEELKVALTATDNLSKVVKGAADAVDKLDGTEAEVTVTAEDKASGEIKTLMDRISGLTDDEKKVVLNAEASKLKREVDDALRLIGKVDGEDAEAVLSAKNNAQAKLDDVQRELDEIDGRPVSATVDADKGAGLASVEGDLKEIDGKTYNATVDADAGPGLSGLLDSLSAAPGAISGIGTNASGLVSRGGAVGVLAALLAGAATATGTMAADVQTLATLTGEDFSYVDKFTQMIDAMSGLSTSDLLEIIAQANETLSNSPELQALLGVTGEDFRQHPLQSIVEIIGDLQEMSADERLVTMFKVFGEEGAKQLAPLIASGQDLADLIEGMPTLVTPEDATNARELQMQWREMVTNFKELAAVIGPVLLPLVSQITEGLTRLTGLEFENDDFVGLEEAMIAATAAGLDTADVLHLMNEEGLTLDAAIAQLTGTTEEAAEGEGELADSTGAATEAIAAQQDAVRVNTELLEDLAKGTRSAADAQLKLGDQVIDTKDAVDEYNTVMSDAEATEDDRADATRRARDEVLALADATVAGAAATAEANGNTLSATTQNQLYTTSLLNQARTLSGPLKAEVLAHAARLLGLPETEVTEILATTDDAELAAIEARLHRLATTTTTHRVVITGSGASATYDYGGGQVARTSGGPVVAGRPYTIGGSHGLETFVPATNGTIIPASQTAAMLGGGVTHVTQENHIHMPPGSNGEDVLNALQRLQRTIGPLPIRTAG